MYSVVVIEEVVIHGTLQQFKKFSEGDKSLEGEERTCQPAEVDNNHFFNHHYTVHLLAVPGPNVLMMLRVVSATLQPILNSNKKITRICFLFNITSIVKNKYKQQVIIH